MTPAGPTPTPAITAWQHGAMGTPPRRSARPKAPVEVRSMSSPKPGWTLEAAVRLLEDGYSPEQVERMTGFAAAHVSAQVKVRRRAADESGD